MNNGIQLHSTTAVTPTPETGKVSRNYSDRRDREYLTESEVEQLQAAAGKVGRHQHRDRTIILMCVIHRHPFTIIGCYEQRNSAAITVGATL